MLLQQYRPTPDIAALKHPPKSPLWLIMYTTFVVIIIIKEKQKNKTSPPTHSTTYLRVFQLNNRLISLAGFHLSISIKCGFMGAYFVCFFFQLFLIYKINRNVTNFPAVDCAGGADSELLGMLTYCLDIWDAALQSLVTSEVSTRRKK